MARPIEATPVLKKKDANTFLREMRCDEPVSAERVEWLKKLAEMSRFESLQFMASLIEEHMTEHGLSETEKDKCVAEARRFVDRSGESC